MSDHTARTISSGQTPSIRLIVNADDFGLSTQINEGIVRAHLQGIVTSTSLMAGGRAFDHAVDCCRHTPTLDVGVHLTVVAGRPVLARRTSLTGTDGCFPASAGVFLGRMLSGTIRRADVEAEWSAQIEHVLAQGIRVTHLDSHQHLHILPGLADLGLRLAAHYRIPFLRVPVESPWAGQWTTPHGIKRVFGAAVLGICQTVNRLVGREETNRRPPGFLGFHDGGRLDEQRLARLLRRLRPGEVYELMCHPGLSPDDDPDIQAWAYRHEAEMHALTSPAIRAEITARGIQLCSFAELLDR